MLNAQAPQPAELAATLRLDEDVRLAGKLSSLLDGRLQLGSARLLSGPAAGGKVSIRPGARATLAITLEDLGTGSLEDVQVSVAGMSGDGIILEFADASGATAQRYR